MTTPINPIQPLPPTGPTGNLSSPPPAEGERGFADILKDSIDKVNQMQVEADLSVEKLFNNEITPEAAMLAYRKAQISFEMLMQIRNKLVDAFDELQRMRI